MILQTAARRPKRPGYLADSFRVGRETGHGQAGARQEPGRFRNQALALPPKIALGRRFYWPSASKSPDRYFVS